MKAVAFANNDIAVVAWTFGGKLPNCLGFAIYRIDVRAGTQTCLPAMATFAGQQATPGRTTADGRVGVWRGGVRPSMSVSAPFVWRCLSGSSVAPFPHPSHRTGRAVRPHPALGQDLTPSSTTHRAQAGSGVRARNTRRGARVDSSRPCVA